MPTLFCGTIKDNITGGKLDAPDEEVEEEDEETLIAGTKELFK